MPTASLSVPHFEQEDLASCVAACARMVLAFHGVALAEADLWLILGTGPRGTTARNLANLSALGFDVQFEMANLARLADLLKAGLPPVVLLDTGTLPYWDRDCYHAAVFVGIDNTAAFLNDPAFATAPQQAPLAGFLLAWAANKHTCAIIRPHLAAVGPVAAP
ncbi:MAG: hypothetical protein K2W96_24965 [Gemmataceae bacterium]|nr:hypothetical protein [Gemmataceae bacterium]